MCIHSQLERLKTEGVVDVFQAIKFARIQRPGIMPNTVCLIDTNLCCVLTPSLCSFSQGSLYLLL